jgi:hypothetical protein
LHPLPETQLGTQHIQSTQDQIAKPQLSQSRKKEKKKRKEKKIKEIPLPLAHILAQPQ